MKYLTLLLLPLMLFVTACGGGSSDQKADQSSATEEATAEVRTINIIGVDQMKYTVDDKSQEGIVTGATVTDSLVLLEAITASPGEKIRIRLTTKSKLPAMAMSHNFVLLKQDTDVDAFDQAASRAKENDYIPSDFMDQIIAHTALAGGGETVEVTFTVPEKTGDYPYLCSFPGHYAAGMKGTLKVQ